MTDADDDSLAILAAIKNLRSLDLRSTLVAGDGLRHLTGCRPLKRLRLRGCLLDDVAYEHLGNCMTLEELDLSGSSCNDEHLAGLGALKRLKSLRISDAPITDASFATLAKLDALEELTVHETFVAGHGIRRLSRLGGLKVIDITTSCVDDAGVAELCELRSLRKLLLIGNDATPDGLMKLAEMPSLEVARLSLRGGKAAEESFQKRFIEAQADSISRRTSSLLPSGEGTPARPAHLYVESQDEEPFSIGGLNRLRDQLRQCPDDLRLAVLHLLQSSDPVGVGRFGVARSMSVELAMDECFCEAIRTVKGPILQFIDSTYGRFGSSRREAIRFIESRRADSRHAELLLKIARRDVGEGEGVAQAAADVVSHPCPETWSRLLNVSRNVFRERVSAAWRGDDHNNSAAWFETYSSVDDYFSNPAIVLPPIKEGNLRHELRLAPRPPAIDDALYRKAMALLADTGFDVKPREASIRRDDPRSWHVPAEIAHSSLACLTKHEEGLAREGKFDEARECREAGETMLRKFLLARPRELGTVMSGCKLARYGFGEWQKSSGTTPQEQRRLQARRVAIEALEATIRRIVDEVAKQGRRDEATVAGWMRGLVDCQDEAAQKIHRALDEWDAYDRKLAGEP